MENESGFVSPTWEGVAVLCKSDDGRSLLMVLQAGPQEEPTWAVPGGSIEAQETPQQAALRETREETGLDIRILRRYTTLEGEKPYGMYRVHYFEALVQGGRLRKRDPDGLIHQVAWVPAAQLAELPLSHADQREVLISFMARGEKRRSRS